MSLCVDVCGCVTAYLHKMAVDIGLIVLDSEVLSVVCKCFGDDYSCLWVMRWHPRITKL